MVNLFLVVQFSTHVVALALMAYGSLKYLRRGIRVPMWNRLAVVLVAAVSLAAMGGVLYFHGPRCRQ